MSQEVFNVKEIKQLKKNPYVKKVSEKSITYQDKFKYLFILQLNEGKTPRMIFEQAGFDVKMIRMKLIEAAASRWKKLIRQLGWLD